MSVRQIVLDTETTGLRVDQGNRIIEIACVEIVHRRISEKIFHVYINPERDSEPGALNVHGLTSEFLAEHPLFEAIANDFIQFITGAELIIHNAVFDEKFLNEELRRAGHAPLRTYCPDILDTLLMAKERFPGKRNNLNALCERFEIDNSRRTLHGALIDVHLLGDVYLAMTQGQETLGIDWEDTTEVDQKRVLDDNGVWVERPRLPVLLANATEINAHEAYLDGIEQHNKRPVVWRIA